MEPVEPVDPVWRSQPEVSLEPAWRSQPGGASLEEPVWSQSGGRQSDVPVWRKSVSQSVRQSVWRSQSGCESVSLPVCQSVSLPVCQSGCEELLCGLFGSSSVQCSGVRQTAPGVMHSGCTVDSAQCTVDAQWMQQRGAVAWNTTRLLYREQSSTIRTHQTVHSAQRTVHSAQWTVHSAQCTVHSAQCTVHSAQCTVDVQWMQHRGAAAWNTTRLLYREQSSTIRTHQISGCEEQALIRNKVLQQDGGTPCLTRLLSVP